jgi:hypothetical protein
MRVEQRRIPRVRMADRPAARVRPSLEARLVDLSLTGARIEHFGTLRPEVPCTIELPGATRPLVLPVRIVWSHVVGTEHSPEGERRLRYQSGLEFIGVTAEQQAILARIQEQHQHGK